MSSYLTAASSIKKLFKVKFAKWVVQQSMPLSIGESTDFIEMIQVANKTIVVPDHKALSDILYEKKTECTRKLRLFLKSRFFSITCDHWTSAAQENYGALTLHVIDNFALKTYVLSCVKHPNGTCAEEIEAQLVTDLNSWGLDRGHFVAAVTDTASNMNSFGRSISSWRDATLLRHHYCADHVLQLTAVKAYSGDIGRELHQPAVDNIEDRDSSILSVKRARDLVSFFHSSSIATEKLRQAQKTLKPGATPLKLVQDVKTRWWSTHDMIKRVLELREALKLVFTEEFRYRDSQTVPTQLEKMQLSDDDFESLENVEYVLKPLQAAQKSLEGERYVNISLLPVMIHHLRLQLALCLGAVDQETQQDLYQLLSSMVADFNERWGDSTTYSREVVRAARGRQVGIPTYAFWATALDPRTKRRISKILHPEDSVRLWDDLNHAVHHLVLYIKDYEGQLHQEQPQQQDPREDEERVNNHMGFNNNTQFNNNFLADSDDEHESDHEHELTLAEILEGEIRAYRADCGQPLFAAEGKYNNPLDWWRVNHEKFPNLWKMASCILAIPATSAPSERVFSAAANIVNKKRVSLKPETVDLLVFLRGNKDFVKWD